jgi:hypothetical protein
VPLALRVLAPAALGLALLAGCGEPESRPAVPTLAEAPYDLEGRPRAALPRIQGWCVAVVVAPPGAAPDLGDAPASTQVVLPSPERWPNLASLLTGLLPSQHGVGVDGTTPSGYARAWITVAEVLRAAYGYETLALRGDAWPTGSAPLLQGFASTPAPGDVLDQLRRWQAERTPDVPFLALVAGGHAPPSQLLPVLRAAAHGRPLLVVSLAVEAARPPAGAPAAAFFADASVLAPIHVALPPGAAAWADGEGLSHLLDGVLARLGAPPIDGARRAEVDAHAAPLARLDWATPTHVLTGVRGSDHTYGVLYDATAGTVEEHLIERAAGRAHVASARPLPATGLDPAFCRAVESVRDRLWRHVDEVRWRVESGYTSGFPRVTSARPPPLCAPER